MMDSALLLPATFRCSPAELTLVGESGPELFFTGPPGKHTYLTMTVGSTATASMSIGVSSNNTGDMFVDVDSGALLIWNGTDWDEIHSRAQPMVGCPCPYCGTLNPPDAAECGTGRWNGCGAPLGVQ